MLPASPDTNQDGSHPCQNQARGIDLTLVTVSSSGIVFKLGEQTGNIYLLTSGLVNSDKKYLTSFSKKVTFLNFLKPKRQA